MTRQPLARRRALGLLAGVAGLGIFATGVGVAFTRAADRWGRAVLSRRRKKGRKRLVVSLPSKHGRS